MAWTDFNPRNMGTWLLAICGVLAASTVWPEGSGLQNRSGVWEGSDTDFPVTFTGRSAFVSDEGFILVTVTHQNQTERVPVRPFALQYENVLLRALVDGRDIICVTAYVTEDFVSADCSIFIPPERLTGCKENSRELRCHGHYGPLAGVMTRLFPDTRLLCDPIDIANLPNVRSQGEDDLPYADRC